MNYTIIILKIDYNLNMSSNIEIYDSATSIGTLLINPIFTTSTGSDEVATNLTNQFLINGKTFDKRYCTKRLTTDQFANLCQSISQGIIDVKKIVKDSANAIQSSTTCSVEATSKGHGKATKNVKTIDKLRSENIKRKLDQEYLEIIQIMKTNDAELLSGDKPTISSLKGIIGLYTRPMANKIMKVIIIRALIRRYTECGEEYLVTLIFEFMMVFLDIKNEWFDPLENDSTEKIISVETTVKSEKVNHRKARMQVIKSITKVVDFDFPTVEELANETFSKRIQQAINNYVQEAKHIIESKEIDPIKYQMIETYYRLKPISTWDAKIMKLDNWQLEVIKMIDNFESFIITAPTSSGKTVCAQYCGTSENINKVLFVVPNSVLANQVAGSFTVSGIKTALITNEEDYNVSDDCKVIVATPYKAEEILKTMSLKLDYAVFDEIQQINDLEGEAIERLIKTVNCPFLILSATIHEPERFVKFLSTVTHRDVKLIQYNKRFIVQQKHIWNGDNLTTMHPLTCVDLQYIIEDQFKTGDLAMTARDLYVMGTDMAVFFATYDESWKLHPDKYFDKSIPITMDMVSIYEKHLKDALIKLAFMDGDLVKEFIKKYSLTNTPLWTADEKDTIPRIVDMLKTLKAKQMLPALMFMLNDVAVLNTFKGIITYLETIESYYFPWYQDFMKNMFDEVNEFQGKEPVLKESIAKGITGRGNKIKQINDSLNQHKRQFISNFLDKINTKYTLEISHAAKNKKLTPSEKEMIESFLLSDYNIKNRNYNLNQLNAVDVKLPIFNPFCPTSIFSFHRTALSVDTMRRVKHSLRKFLSQTVDKSIAKDMSYNNIFIRGLERGLILYSKILPTPFQRVVQELIVNHQAPVCICDDSLAYGVNFPTRTVVILGNKECTSIDDCEEVSILKAHQMSGRSGRRNYDTQGHIVYCRVNYMKIMRGTYTPLIGKDTITPYTLLPGKIFESEQYIKDVIEVPLKLFMENNPLNNWNKQELLNSFQELYMESDLYKQDGIMTLLLWLYRDEPNIAYNIFVLTDELTKYHQYISIDTTHKLESSANDDDDEIKSTHSDDIVIHKMPQYITFQLVEMLMRVFDREEDPDTEINDLNYVNSDIKFVEMLTSDKWPLPLNMGNSDIIKCIFQNKIFSDDFGYIAKIIDKVHRVILSILKMYNLFAQIGNQSMINVLEQPLNHLIAFNNKLKSLN